MFVPSLEELNNLPTGTQTINGKVYQYKYKSRWNKEKKRSEQDRFYMGVVEDGKLIPNDKYRLLLLLEKRKSDDITQPATNGDEQEISGKFWAGATYLLDKISENTDVKNDLQEYFPLIWSEILSLAFYTCLEQKSPLYRFNHWHKNHDHPCKHPITSQESSALLTQIKEGQVINFFKKQFQRRMEKELIAYDTTSISFYAKKSKGVKNDYNKNGVDLKQITMLMLYGEESGLPIYYKKLPGNIVDVKTIENATKDLDFFDLNKIKLVMDRVFFSNKNVDILFDKKFRFLMGAKLSVKYIIDKIIHNRDDIINFNNYNLQTKNYCKTFVININQLKKIKSNRKRNIYLHMYFDDYKRVTQNANFKNKIVSTKNDCINGTPCQNRYKKFFSFKQSKNNTLTVAIKQKVVDEAVFKHGFMALISNTVKSGIQALALYRKKDLVEKAYCGIKSRFFKRTAKISSKSALDGAFFIQYIALIFMSYIKNAMEKHNLFNTYEIDSLLDTIDAIEKNFSPGQKPFFEPITEEQRRIFICLDVDPPSTI
jgi:transposase